MTDRVSQLREQAENAPPPKALAAAQQLLQLLHPLAQESAVEYQGQLGDAWRLYGTNAGIVQGAGAAVEPLTTAVGLLRQAASERDAMSQIRLVQALQTLAETHIALEQAEAAHPLLQEAHAAGERLSRLEPAAFPVVDARTSRLLASMYLSRRDYDSAITHGQDAEARLRDAVRNDRSVEPELATTLRTLALCLDADEFREDAELPPDSENMSMDEIARTLAERVVERATVRAEAAGTDDVVRQLKHENKHVTARKKEAQRKIEEAHEIYRRLAKRQPDLYLADYAHSVQQLAEILAARGKKFRAVAEFERSVDLFARAVQLNPALQEAYLAAAQDAVDANVMAGNEGRAQKLSRRYGL